MTLENQDIIQVKKKQRCYSLFFAGAVACQTYCLGGLQVLFPDLSHSFTSCQLLVKDEH